MSKKFYAVRKGYTTGIFEKWSDCLKSVHGYSGAEYKSFKTIEEAENYLNQKEEKVTRVIDDLDSGEAIAYVDGSYRLDQQRYSYGIVFFTNKGKEYFSGYEENEFAVHRNVAGEVYGAMKAMKLCLEKEIKELYLHYDYAGIEYWATGEWKRNNKLTKWYYDECQKYFERINVHFIKVEAHSGNQYNDEADCLAKKALGLS